MGYSKLARANSSTCSDKGPNRLCLRCAHALAINRTTTLATVSAICHVPPRQAQCSGRWSRRVPLPPTSLSAAGTTTYPFGKVCSLHVQGRLHMDSSRMRVIALMFCYSDRIQQPAALRDEVLRRKAGACAYVLLPASCERIPYPHAVQYQ